jgi:hypothetical protein
LFPRTIRRRVRNSAAGPAGIIKKLPGTEFFMKKISLVGLLLGGALGAVVVLVFGKWLFWLALGLTIGAFIGSMQARRARLSGAIRPKISA